MSLTRKKPKVGDTIEHTCTLNGTYRGKVKQLLGMQFTYITEDTGFKKNVFVYIKRYGNMSLIKDETNEKVLFVDYHISIHKDTGHICFDKELTLESVQKYHRPLVSMTLIH